MVPGNEIEEVAKAVQEASKTATKALELAEQSGPFLHRVFGGPVEDAVGLVWDRLRFYRLRNFYKLQKYTQQELVRLDVKQPRQLEVPFALPLIEAAALEEDELLQRIWAQLLANALNPNYAHEIHRGFVSMLRECGPLEVRVLDLLVSQHLFLSTNNHTPAFYTFDLPDRVHTEEPGKGQSVLAYLPSRETQVALWNLMRLGCLDGMNLYGGNSSISIVGVTELGSVFWNACSLGKTAQ